MAQNLIRGGHAMAGFHINPSAVSRLVESDGQPEVMQGDLSPGFMVDLAHKDLGLALDLAAQKKSPDTRWRRRPRSLLVGAHPNRGVQDWTGIDAMLRELAGLPG
jgi:hypothetical protein